MQLSSVLKRKDIQYLIAFILLYIVWIIWPIYGIVPFFVFTAMIVRKYMKTRKALQRLTMEVKAQFPDRLPEEKWKLLMSYGLAIYTPKDAYALAMIFRVCELGGYICVAVLAIQQRWPDVMACFSASMFALQMQRTLQPESYFMKRARKNPDEYGPKAQAIRELQAWVVSDDAP
jgi:hypothetical protein